MEAGGRETKKEIGAHLSVSLKDHCVYVATPLSLQAGNSTSKQTCFGFEGIPVLAFSPAKFEKVHLAKYELR